MLKYLLLDLHLRGFEMAGEIKNLSITEGTTVSTPTDNPLFNQSIHTVTNGDYTVLDDDGYDLILFSTGSTTRTLTLPTASANSGRVITIKKTDGGSGYVIIDGEGSETVDGTLTKSLFFINNFRQLVCNGTSWFVVAEKIDSDWINWTPISTIGTTNVSHDGYYRKHGPDGIFRVKSTFTGQANDTILRYDTPTGLTMDNSIILDNGNTAPLGEGNLLDSGTAYFDAVIIYQSATQVGIRYLDNTPDEQTNTNLGASGLPFVSVSGNTAYATWRAPIVEWSES